MRLTRTIGITLLCTALAVSALARNPDVPPIPSASPITAKAGNWAWSDPNAWTPAGVPGNGAVVLIPQNATVTLTGDSARILWIEVSGNGHLALSSTASSRLFVETIFVDTGASFTLTPALPQSATAKVIFTSNGTFMASDTAKLSRGLVAEGRVVILGQSLPKTPFVPVATDVLTGTSTLTMATAPQNWQVGDEVVLTGTYFRRGAPLQDERRTITAIAGTSVTVSSPFSFGHRRVGGMNLHLANLTRNVTFQSETTTSRVDRGHVMLEHRDTDIEQVAFVNLGRTDKSIKLDDVVYDPINVKVTKGSAPSNKRGRYAVHVHETEKNTGYTPWMTPPATPPTVIKGCVVDGTIGWGFVSHSSYVDFRDDVAVNFTGAGFVTEGGDELGNFINDIAIHGTGDGAYRKVRLNFANAARPQPLADFAFSGHGFWFSGPALRVSGIVANSCNGDGVIWHPTGTVDVTNTADAFTGGTGAPNGRYHYFPEAWIPTVYATFPGYNSMAFFPRHWTQPGQAFSTWVVAADLPILQCDNIDSYANLIGFRPRFSNHDSVDFYFEVPGGQPAGQTRTFGYDTQMIAANGQTDKRLVPSRLTQTIGVSGNPALGLRLWNNEEAIGLRYVDKTNWYNVSALNRLDYDESAPANNPAINPAYGIEMFFALANQTFTSLTIDGYEMAAWRINGTSTGGVAFVGKTVLNNAADETWTTTGVMPVGTVPTGLSNDPPGTTVNVHWTSNGASKYLIRFRPTGAQQWQYVTAAAGSGVRTATLAVPQRNTAYQWQIDAGFASGSPVGISAWSAAQSFTTGP